MRVILSTLFVVLSAYVYSQVDSIQYEPANHKSGLWQRVKDDGTFTAKTIVGTYARPFHWQRKEWLTFGAILGTSVAVTLLDEPLYEYVKDHQSETADKITDFADFLGQPGTIYPIMIALWGTGVLANNDWLRDTGIMVFASVTTSGLIQTAAKGLVGRARPSTEEGPYSFKPFGGIPYHSFPSGHVMLSIATSWIMARQVNWLPAKVVFYTLPAIVGASRIYKGAHWLSDVLLGAALGIACAESVLRIYPKLKTDKESNFSFMPSINGFHLAYHFR